MNLLHCNLSRIDIKYVDTIPNWKKHSTRWHKRFKTRQLAEFSKLNKETDVVTIGNDSHSTAIGNRKNAYWLRYYDQEDEIHYELEFKQKATHKCEKSLKEDKWEEFEIWVIDTFTNKTDQIVTTKLTRNLKKKKKALKQILEEKRKKKVN